MFVRSTTLHLLDDIQKRVIIPLSSKLYYLLVEQSATSPSSTPISMVFLTRAFGLNSTFGNPWKVYMVFFPYAPIQCTTADALNFNVVVHSFSEVARIWNKLSADVFVYPNIQLSNSRINRLEQLSALQAT